MTLEQIVTTGWWTLSMSDETGSVVIIGPDVRHPITIPREDAVWLAFTILGWEPLEESRKAMAEADELPLP